MYLKVICAWCGKFIRMKEVSGTDEPTLPITHSICPECKSSLEGEIERSSSKVVNQTTTTKMTGDK